MIFRHRLLLRQLRKHRRLESSQFTDWQEFRNPDFSVMAAKLRQRLIFDGRNLYDPLIVKRAGFGYHCIGRPRVMT